VLKNKNCSSDFQFTKSRNDGFGRMIRKARTVGQFKTVRRNVPSAASVISCSTGAAVVEVGRKLGIREATYNWKRKHSGRAKIVTSEMYWPV
jgi:hypothetical protein